MINLPLFIDFEIPLPFTESEEGPLLLLINQGLLGIIMIVFSFLFLLLGVAIANRVVADRVPHIHPTTGIGGSIISPIPDQRKAMPVITPLSKIRKSTPSPSMKIRSKGIFIFRSPP